MPRKMDQFLIFVARARSRSLRNWAREAKKMALNSFHREPIIIFNCLKHWPDMLMPSELRVWAANPVQHSHKHYEPFNLLWINFFVACASSIGRWNDAYSSLPRNHFIHNNQWIMCTIKWAYFTISQRVCIRTTKIEEENVSSRNSMSN